MVQPPNAGMDRACIDCPLISRTLYGALHPHEIESLRCVPSYRAVRPRALIHRLNEVPDEIYSVRSGWAIRFMLLPDGRRQILSIYLPGDFISLQALQNQPLWFAVQALSNVELCALQRTKFASLLAQHPVMARRLQRFCALHTANLDNRLVDIGKCRAIERVVKLLLKIEARFASLGEIGSDGSFPFLLRHEHIADALGLTRVHVSRTISLMRKENMAAIDDSRATILDRGAMLDAAGLADDTLRFEEEMFVA
ncbi:MAG: Crp/Fnr family transcriptional regulator [Rhodospirillaceae bacterium]